MRASLVRWAQVEYHGAHLRLVDAEARIRRMTPSRRQRLQVRLARHLNALTRLGVPL